VPNVATSSAVHFDISLTTGGASIIEAGTHFYGGNIGEDFYGCVDGGGAYTAALPTGNVFNIFLRIIYMLKHVEF